MEDEDSSLSVVQSLAPSDAISANVSTATTGAKSRTALATWAHTRTPKGDEPAIRGSSKILYCKYCETYSSPVTTNFRSHLRTKHGIHVTEVSSSETVVAEKLQILYRNTNLDGTIAIRQEVLESVLDRDAILDALTTLVIRQNLSFRIVESPDFQVFCQTLNPQSKPYIVTAHSTIPKLIDKMWQEKKDIIRRMVQSASSNIHLSLDIWTSPNSHLFLGICAHFVDQKDKLCKALLGLPIVGDHSGEEQFTALRLVLEDYGIFKKLGAIIGDNATTNDVLCRLVDEHFDEQGVVWNASLRRVRCLGHIINLAVNAFLFKDIDADWETKKEEEVTPALGPLQKLHNIVVHIRGSPGRMKEFKNLAGRLISLDNRTRWNSWYLMLQIANKYAPMVDTYTKHRFGALERDFLSPADWKYLQFIETFLQPFYRATLETEGDKATIDRVLFSMDILIQCLTDALAEHATHKEFSARIKNAWDIFDKYYAKTDESAFYATALILHPAYRIAYIRSNWKSKWVKPTLKKVKDLWVSYKESQPPLSSFPTSQVPTPNLDKYDLVAKNLRKQRPASQDEYDDYSNGDQCETGVSPLEWWCQEIQRKRWPRLSCMAIDILSIPAMSAEPERVFSGARRTISWDRSRLSPTTVEKVECLKHWLKSRILEEGI